MTSRKNAICILCFIFALSLTISIVSAEVPNEASTDSDSNILIKVYNWVLSKIGNHEDIGNPEADPVAVSLSEQAYSLNNAGEYDKALAVYNKAIELDPNYAVGWNGKGNALFNLGQYDEALMAINKAIELDPNFVNASNDKGVVLVNLDRNDEALAAFNKAIELDQKNTLAWKNKGYLLLSMGRYQEAVSAYDKVIELDPNNVQVKTNLDIATSKLSQGTKKVTPSATYDYSYEYYSYIQQPKINSYQKTVPTQEPIPEATKNYDYFFDQPGPRITLDIPKAINSADIPMNPNRVESIPSYTCIPPYELVGTVCVRSLTPTPTPTPSTFVSTRDVRYTYSPPPPQQPVRVYTPAPTIPHSCPDGYHYEPMGKTLGGCVKNSVTPIPTSDPFGKSRGTVITPVPTQVCGGDDHPPVISYSEKWIGAAPPAQPYKVTVKKVCTYNYYTCNYLCNEEQPNYFVPRS